ILLLTVCKAFPITSRETSEQRDSLSLKEAPVEVRKFAGLIKERTGFVSVIESNMTEVISDGLTCTRITYRNTNNRQNTLYILLADLAKGVTLLATTAKNGTDLNAKETVDQQVMRVKERGYDVLAAVNGDVWKVD